MSDAVELTHKLERQLEQQQAASERFKKELARFNVLMETSPHAMWQRGADMQLTYANRAFTELAEHAIDAAEEEASPFHVELFRGHSELAKKALETGQAQQTEHHVVSGGQRRLYQISEVPAGDNVINGYAIDIHEVHTAREEVQRHVSAQRDFLESTTSAMAVYDAEQRLKFYNFSFVAMWKLEEFFLDSSPTYGEVLEKLREQRKLPEQSNFPQFKKQHTRLFTELIETHEEFFYLPDGKTIRVFAIPHALGGLLFAYEDVTDRLALEQSYNTLIAVQRETLDNLREGVVVVGEDGRVKLSNPTFARLWELEEAALNHEPHIRDIREQCRSLFKDEDREAENQAFIARLQSRQLHHGQLERTDGKVLSWRCVPLPDGASLLTYNDITDSVLLERSLRERNEALEAADKMKTDFLANMSYELRSPLTSIMGFSDILSNAYFGELTEKQQEYIGGIQKSSQQLSYLINNILDLASIGAGYMQLNLSDIDIESLLISVRDLVRERIRAVEMDIQVLCDTDIGSMQGDESRLRQILFNLLNNSVKYSQGTSEIQLIARVNNAGEIVLEVRDFGVGISPEKQAYIFDRFYRAGATQGQQSGSGLGLTIVKNFVELHHGRVDVSSAPEEGATFSCYFPRTQPEKTG